MRLDPAKPGRSRLGSPSVPEKYAVLPARATQIIFVLKVLCEPGRAFLACRPRPALPGSSITGACLSKLVPLPMRALTLRLTAPLPSWYYCFFFLVRGEVFIPFLVPLSFLRGCSSTWGAVAPHLADCLLVKGHAGNESYRVLSSLCRLTHCGKYLRQ